MNGLCFYAWAGGILRVTYEKDILKLLCLTDLKMDKPVTVNCRFIQLLSL